MVRGCKRCVDDLKMMGLDNFILKSNCKHDYAYNYSEVEYKGSKVKVNIICANHGIFNQTPDNHLNGRGCPSCDISKKSNTEDFISKSKKIYSDLYNYSLVEYQDNKKSVRIICKVHGTFNKSPNNHLRGQGCPKCKKISNKKKTEYFINESFGIHGDRYDYSLVDYEASNKKVDIICKKHGKFKQNPNNHLIGQGCPICKNSKGENLISEFLKSNEIDYIREHKFKDCRSKYPLRFDFYLPKLKTCIEFNGIQHYESIEYFSRNSALEYTQLKDSIKMSYCEKNKIKFIVIRYDDNIIKKLKESIK